MVLLKLHVAGLLNEWPVALGAGMLIVAALGSARLSRVLCAPALTWLGRVSYSLYLFHDLIMLGMFAFAPAWLPFWMLQLGVAVTSLGCATLAWRFFEQPSIRWGRALSARLDKKALRLKPAPLAAPSTSQTSPGP
jgi:peptidoglycan/LPS O-acetylase OafA/YrhL